MKRGKMGLPICKKELDKARKRSGDVESLALECNTLFVDKISKLEKHLEELNNICPGRELQVLVDDAETFKADFINECKCIRSKKHKT